MDKKGSVGHIEKDKKNKAKAKPHYSIISIISLQVVNNQRHQPKLCGNCFNQICADKQNMKKSHRIYGGLGGLGLGHI